MPHIIEVFLVECSNFEIVLIDAALNCFHCLDSLFRLTLIQYSTDI